MPKHPMKLYREAYDYDAHWDHLEPHSETTALDHVIITQFLQRQRRTISGEKHFQQRNRYLVSLNV